MSYKPNILTETDYRFLKSCKAKSNMHVIWTTASKGAKIERRGSRWTLGKQVRFADNHSFQPRSIPLTDGESNSSKQLCLRYLSLKERCILASSFIFRGIYFVFLIISSSKQLLLPTKTIFSFLHVWEIILLATVVVLFIFYRYSTGITYS